LPGRHRLDLSLRGYQDQSGEVDLAAHRSQDVTLTLVQASGTPAAAATPAPVAAAGPAPAPTPADQPREQGGSGFGIWPWVTLGAGGAALGGALVFELLRRGTEDDAKNDKTQVGYQEKLDKMESQQTAARILAGVGGALVVTGGVLLVLDLSSDKKQTATLTIAPTQGGAFAFASGTY
jgi:hypothetical protein